MRMLTARNVHRMLPIALDLLFKDGVPRQTRNGPVLQLPGPTLLCYERPWERVMFWAERDANPFFHLMEAMWMLAGRNDVASLSKYTKGISKYSDDGTTFNGAYGYRWRGHFCFDQLDEIVRNLNKNRDDRRQVLTMWQSADLLNQAGTKDLPCNTHVYFAVNHRNELEMTVCNRSNDLVWGCLGANAVHFSILQEYIACRTGLTIGNYYQFTNNLHGYLSTAEPLKELVRYQGEACPYELGQVTDQPLGWVFDDPDRWFIKPERCDSVFFTRVIMPMEAVHAEVRAKNLDRAWELCSEIGAKDWARACSEWVHRRITKRNRAQDDGVSHE